MYPVRSLRKTERKQDMIKKYSEEKRLEVINARKDGATIAQISAQTGVGQTTVKAWLKNAVPQKLLRKNTESVKVHFTVCIKKETPSLLATARKLHKRMK